MQWSVWDVFVARYAADGAVTWVRGAGAYAPDEFFQPGDITLDVGLVYAMPTDVVALANGTVVLRGGFEGYGSYVIRTGMTAEEQQTRVVAAMGPVFGAGEANETRILGTPDTEFTGNGTVYTVDGFLARLGTDGNLAWARTTPTTAYAAVNGGFVASQGTDIVGYDENGAVLGTRALYSGTFTPTRLAPLPDGSLLLTGTSGEATGRCARARRRGSTRSA